jgi:hypothetical protein
MRALITPCAVVLALLLSAPARAGGPAGLDAHMPPFVTRLGPKGGCNPDGRGLFHWWNPHCFSRSCGPDIYCRKPMPNVCRPRSPAFGPYVQSQPKLPPRPPSR